MICLIYQQDATNRVYRRKDRASFRYSDGEANETKLLHFLQSIDDCGTFSPEVKKGIHDWPSEYHLSVSRHHLLRPLPIQAGDKVLELGCGCGALTRYLGEIGAEVTAVEGSWARACIAAERCRDLPNVQIICEDFLSFVGAAEYQWVLLVGVLEYAPVYSPEPDPVQHYLQTAKQFLSPQGKLVVAIENQLGLKYFNGCTEDHVGEAYFGLQDFYGHKTPVTFGRRVLSEQLQAADCRDISFFYPFPDYKIPQVIVSESGFQQPGFQVADMLLSITARDYSGKKLHKSFSDPLVAQTLEKNGLLQDLSNSFLVVASVNCTATKQIDDTLAWSFSSHRIPELMTETLFLMSKGTIFVKKKRATHPNYVPELPVAGYSITHREFFSAYYSGQQLSESILKMQIRTNDLTKIADAFQPWLQFLMTQATCKKGTEGKKLADWFIAGRYLDCTPDNLVFTGDSAIPYREIDQEWQVNKEIPLGWVFTRGIIHSITFRPPRKKDVIKIVLRLSHQIDLSCDTLEILDWIAMEDELQAALAGHVIEPPSFFYKVSAQVSAWICMFI